MTVSSVRVGLERAAHDREDRQVVDRDPEAPLDLRCVRVERHDVVDADGLHHVGDGACRHGHPASRPLVGSRVREVRDDGGDAVRVGTPAGIGDHEQLDQMVVHRRRHWLNDEHVVPTDRLLELGGDLAVGEALHTTRAERSAEVHRNVGREPGVRGAGKDHEWLRHA